jgi:LCP family protein required for cell wall assembly
MDTPQPSGGRRFDGPVRRLRRPLPAPSTNDVESQQSAATQPPLEVISAPAQEVASTTVSNPSEIMPAPVTRPTREKRTHTRRRVILGIIALVIVALVAWFGYHALAALNSVIQKHAGKSAFGSQLDLSSLRGEGSGRVNILVLGIGGAGHDGPNLSDTMMVWSIDPKTYDVAAISVPRDLYAKIPGYGYGKINAANADSGPQLAEKVVSTILGVDINYYVVVDFSGFKQAIDAVGGVDITVPTALFDKQYPCDVGNGVCPYSQPAGTIHMSGSQALKYSRCRHNDPGIGNCGNDYGRAARQQQVVSALKSRALSAGTLTNPAKLTSLIDTVGSHVKTDLQLSDLKILAQLAGKIDTAKIVNKVLDDAPDSYLVGGTNIVPAAGYIYVPKAGLYDYSDIHDFVKNIFFDRYITSENARVAVENGSGITGLAGRVVTSLTSAHYNVGPATNAVGTFPHTLIYDYTNGKKPYTIKYLEQRFNVTAAKATQVPAVTPTGSPTTGVNSPEIRIILGSDYQTSTSTTPTN